MSQQTPPIEVDRPDTWPSDLVALIEVSLPALQRWRSREDEIDELCRTDVMARIHPPRNGHAAASEEFVEAVEEVLAGHRLMGRHCTRLALEEVDSIRRNGMEPLSVSLLERRIEGLLTAGHMTESQARELQRRNEWSEEGREGVTWWIFGRSVLQDAGAVGRLFRSWGGEATYVGRETSNPDAQKHWLARIGAPCIVEAALPHGMVEDFMPVGQRFRDALTRNRPVEFEGRTRTVVPGDLIAAVIVHGSNEFEELTATSSWDFDLG